MHKKNRIRRRNFLKQSAIGIIGAGMAAKAGCVKEAERSVKEEEKPLLKIQQYRVLGRTGFKVSDIGAGAIQDEGVLGTAFDAGVNYVDTHALQSLFYGSGTRKRGYAKICRNSRSKG